MISFFAFSSSRCEISDSSSTARSARSSRVLMPASASLAASCVSIPSSFSSSGRSEEHTAELQSPCNLVCRLLLENTEMHHDRLAVLVEHDVILLEVAFHDAA